METTAPTISPRLRIGVWVIVIVVALIGVVVAIASASLWPLIAFLALAVPMLPFSTRDTRGRTR